MSAEEKSKTVILLDESLQDTDFIKSMDPNLFEPADSVAYEKMKAEAASKKNTESHASEKPKTMLTDLEFLKGIAITLKSIFK